MKWREFELWAEEARNLAEKCGIDPIHTTGRMVHWNWPALMQNEEFVEAFADMYDALPMTDQYRLPTLTRAELAAVLREREAQAQLGGLRMAEAHTETPRWFAHSSDWGEPEA